MTNVMSFLLHFYDIKLYEILNKTNKTFFVRFKLGAGPPDVDK